MKMFQDLAYWLYRSYGSFDAAFVPLLILIVASFGLTSLWLWVLVSCVHAWGFWWGATLFWFLLFAGNVIRLYVVPPFVKWLLK